MDIFHGDGSSGWSHDCITQSDSYVLVPPSGCIDTDFPLTPPHHSSITTGDINGNKKLDVVSLFNGNCRAGILLGRGDGTFLSKDLNTKYFPSVYPVDGILGDAVFPIQIILADLDDDGFDDIITTNHHSHNISVVINAMQLLPIGP